MVLVDPSNAWMRFISCTAFRIVSAASNDICKYFLELSAKHVCFYTFIFFLPSGDDANAETSHKKFSSNFAFMVYLLGDVKMV